tara:strand:+ start:657 stop:1073 length:417 start_codon:yes stop_codon:yes gene_type:complete
MESNLSCQNLKKNYNNTNKIIYDLIFLQISNLISDLRVVLPNDIVLKVCQDNLKCFNKNKIETIDYFKKCLDNTIINLIKNKDEYLFSEDNKSLKNIKFKRSSFVFNKIRKNWHILNINDKTVVWKYLNFILKLLEQV